MRRNKVSVTCVYKSKNDTDINTILAILQVVLFRLTAPFPKRAGFLGKRATMMMTQV